MEKIDLGQYKVSKGWDDVTLEQWQNYIKMIESKKGEDIDIITTLEHFSNIPRNVIYQMPTEMFNKVISNLKWINEEPKYEISNMIELNGEIFHINTMHKLKVKEYLDLNTIIENDKYDYYNMFTVICRKEDEEYNEDYIASKWEERSELFANAPMTKIFPLIGFFLNLWEAFVQHSVNSLMADKLKSELIEVVKNIKSSLKVMDYIIPSRLHQILTLRKLEKSLMNI